MHDDVLYSIRSPKTMYEMTGAEVRAALKDTDIVLLPVGALEDHGPHLPLGTDVMEARELCRRLAIALHQTGPRAVIGPAIPFGASSYHLDFPGTVSISSTTLLALLREVCFSLYRGGFRRFVLIHGHGGNFPLMQVAAQEIQDERPDATVVCLNWFRALTERYHEILRSKKGESHGGEGETARILVTHPELVDLEKAEPFYLSESDLRRIQGPENPLMGGGVFYASRSYKTMTPVGSIGNGALATEEVGEKGYEIAVEWMARIIRRDMG